MKKRFTILLGIFLVLSSFCFSQSSSEYETVGFAKIKTFPARYAGKKIKLEKVCFSPEDVCTKTCFNDKIGLSVWNVDQTDRLAGFTFNINSIMFTVNESIVDKILDNIQSGYLGYFNIYTDKVYSMKTTAGDVCYFANIVRVERCRRDGSLTGAVWE